MCKFRVCLGLALLAVAGAAMAADAPKADYKPWALRDHYSFEGDRSVLKVDVQTAEWMIEVNGLGVLVKDAQCELEYADGRVLRLSSLKAVRDSRESFDGPLGKGTRFHSVFVTPDELEIDFSVSRLLDHPAMLVHLNMTNLGKKPVLIKEVRPVVFDPGAVADIGDATVVTQARTQRRGNYSVVNDGASAGLVVFEVKKPAMTLGIGLLQSGMMNSSVDLQPSGKSYVGAVHCRYLPLLAIKPGTKVGCDPVWMSQFVPQAGEVSKFYAWADAQGRQPAQGPVAPRGWATAQRGAPAAEVYKIAEAWVDHSVDHVLVPAGWQAASGSLQGKEPGYPKDMSKVAGELVKRGMKPGITFDPLATDETKDWTVAAADGTRWLDLSKPQAREQVKKAAEKLAGMGYTFFVVGPSTMPDDVLEKFNVTRAQVDLFAFQALSEAVRDRPVMPSPALTIGGELSRWREAINSTEALVAYGASSGPVQVDTDKISTVSKDLATAISAYEGPVEVTGTPKKDVRDAVGRACCLAEPAQTAKKGGNAP